MLKQTDILIEAWDQNNFVLTTIGYLIREHGYCLDDAYTTAEYHAPLWAAAMTAGEIKSRRDYLSMIEW